MATITKNRLTRRFSVIPNQIVDDTTISHAAFRIYCYLVGKPDGWQVLNSDIKTKLKIKDDTTLANYWKQLIRAGWITRERNTDEKGQFVGGFQYILNEFPQPPENEPESPPESELGEPPIKEATGTGKIPCSENPQDLIKKDIRVNKDSNKKTNKKSFDRVEEVEEIFQFWQQTMGKHKAVLDDKRHRFAPSQ